METDIDLLRPIGKNNRKEHIVVEYDGFIKSIPEMYLLALLNTPNIDTSVYKLLEDYSKVTPDELHDIISFVTPYQAVRFLMDNYEMTDEDCQNELDDKLRNRAHLISDSKDSIFGFALTNLIAEDFVVDISIIKNTNFYSYEIDALNELFKDHHDKLHLFTGNISGLVLAKYDEDHEVTKEYNYKYTTIGLSDLDELEYLIDNIPEKDLSDTFFILRDTISSIDHVDEKTQGIIYKNEDKYMKYLETHKTVITHMPNMCMPDDLAEDTEEIDN